MTKTKVGISHGGQSAEERYRAATGAEKPPKTSLGDAVIAGNFVEVKQASSKTKTLNQVRAVKYIPLVAYDKPMRTWYVVPAQVVVALVSPKSRGQHTENPFESATLSIKDLGHYAINGEHELRAKTLAAIASARKYPELRAAMESILTASRKLAKKSISRVREILERHKLVG